MVKRLSIFTFCAILGVLLAGCPKKPDPNPGDTVMGAGGVNNPNFVPGDPGFGPEFGDDYNLSQGLEEQNSDFMDPNAPVLVSVYFDYDQSFIREDQRSYLMESFEYLQNNPGSRLLVEGHCDFKGTTEYNIALGDRRSNSVKTFLVQLGVQEDRIETLSKGDLESIENASDEQRALDRRADLKVVSG